MLKLYILAVCVLYAQAYNLRKRWEGMTETEAVGPAFGEQAEDFEAEVADFEPADDFGLQNAFIAAHNKWRSAEGAGLPNVNWDGELARMAAANVAQCAMRHDVRGKSTAKYPYIGQNLYMTSLKDLGGDDAAVKSLAAWMSEKKDYNYGSNSCSRVCGHYTQVVWKDSTNIGCAVSTGCSGGTFVACNYGPAGNFMGKKPY